MYINLGIDPNGSPEEDYRGNGSSTFSSVSYRSPPERTSQGADPEIALLFLRFQGMSEEAREQIKQLFETVDAMDKKKMRRSREPN